MPVEHDKFAFFLPIDLVKSDGGDAAPERRLIRGVASTESQDLQEEIVRARGIDTSYFLQHGFINDDHRPIYVGEPLSVKPHPTHVEMDGLLYGGRDCHKSESWACADCRADYWWSLINAVGKARDAGSKRKVGFSIEGKVQRRDGNVIEKCWLKNIAITANPINTDTYAEVVKSLTAQPWCSQPEVGTPCKCDGCRAGTEVAQKSRMDGLSYREAVEWIVREKGWNPVAADVVAKAIFAARINPGQ